jgi:hypothetical protein
LVNGGDVGERRCGDRAAVLSPEEKGARWCSPESGRAAALSPKEEGAQRRLARPAEDRICSVALTRCEGNFETRSSIIVLRILTEVILHKTKNI